MLENSVELWENVIFEDANIPISYWPHLPGLGGICIFEGRLKELMANDPNLHFPTVIAILPRPNQAFWTLSAIWSGWLLGKNAVTPFRSVLQRKRYDWGWHTRALHSVFEELARLKKQPIHINTFIEEYEPHFLSASLIAGDKAGLFLKDFAYQSDEHRAQIGWSLSSALPLKSELINKNTISDSVLQHRIEEVLYDYIDRFNEPLSFAKAHAIAISNLVHFIASDKQNSVSNIALLDVLPFEKINDFPNTFQDLLIKTIKESHILLSIPNEDKPIENKYLWIKGEQQSQIVPISDKIELESLKFFQQNKTFTYAEFLEFIYHKFRGFATPAKQLLEICFSSYSKLDPQRAIWEIRQEDEVEQRIKDLDEMKNLIYDLGKKLNVEVLVDRNLSWKTPQGEIVNEWLVQSTGFVSEIFNHDDPIKKYLVIPGSRVKLILFKLRHNPIANEIFQHNWKIVRFRQLRWIIEQPDVDFVHFEKLLNLDPLQDDTPQLSFW
ncbi:MAG: hypothetical protein ACPL3P_01835 [Anaerolineales bacterium]